MHRSSVDLPLPGRADQADDLVLGDLEVDPLEHLERPNDLCRPSIRRASGSHPGRRAAGVDHRRASRHRLAAAERAALLARDQPVDEPGHAGSSAG